jgi:7-cyano-7-deazaguanine reductase
MGDVLGDDVLGDRVLRDCPLGKKVFASASYDPKHLFPIPRSRPFPFEGVDIWNGYELSWLNQKGRPEVAIGEFVFSCKSENLIESKSFKLYLNSFSQTPFASADEVTATIKKDLETCSRGDVAVTLRQAHNFGMCAIENFLGACLDHLDIAIDTYRPNSKLLRAGSGLTEESLYTNLFQSNCPVTGQPDWASIFIFYNGPKIDHEALLRYLISFRSHQGFHEAVTETIFLDILRECRPEKLSVSARFLRRGGLDINPFRSNFEKMPRNFRLPRQ